MKKLAVMLLACICAFGLIGCGQSSSENGTEATEETGSTETTKQEAVSADDINAQIVAITEKENDIIAGHRELWDKVFNNIDKDEAQNSTETNYGKFLEEQLNKVTDQFSEEELASLNEDIEAIKAFEDQMVEIVSAAEVSGTDASDIGMSIAVDENGNIIEDSEPFPAFEGKNFDGTDVDSSIFSQNAVTVVNFWFNGCTPCVEELPTLNQLNESLKEQGGAVIGVNSDTLDGNEEIIAEAKSILEEQGAAYQNIYFDSDSEAGQYVSNIMAFPTTILVDRNGNIIGEPILGGLNNEDNLAALQERINAIIAKDGQ